MINIKDYFKSSSELISKLHTHGEKITAICNEILKCKKNKKKILVAGNGGSCSDAEHFVGELQCTYKDRERDSIKINIWSMIRIDRIHIDIIQYLLYEF